MLHDGVDKKIIAVDYTRIWRDKQAGFNFDPTINLWYCDEFMTDGSKQNRYIDNLLDGKRKRYWRGPLLVISGLATKSFLQSQFVLDVIPNDVLRGGQYFATTGHFADEPPEVPDETPLMEFPAAHLKNESAESLKLKS